MLKKGDYVIDISHWQGNVDFGKVVKDGISGAIIKVNQNQSKDSNFIKNYGKGYPLLPIGGYIYSKVYSVAEAKKEAEFAIRTLEGRDMPLGIWLDIEENSMKKLGKNLLTEIISAESDILGRNGYKVGIYCNRDWYLNVLDSAKLSKLYPFWVARYPKVDNGEVKTSLSVESLNNCKMWQYTSKATVDGIKGNVDKSLLYSSLFAKNEVVTPVVVNDAHQVFINEILSITSTSKVTDALLKTVTISKSKNRNHAFVTAWERYLKALGYYNGSIEADSGKKPVFGSGLESAVKLYQRDVVKASAKNQDGIITGLGASWKCALGIK